MNDKSPSFFYFDLGNVLLRFDRQVACRQIGVLAGLAESRVEQLLFDSGLQASYEDGQVSSRRFYDQFCIASGKRPDYAAFHQAGSRIFELNVPVVPILCQLRAAGHSLGILSNTCESHWRQISGGNFGVIGALFDVHILSYEVRSSKPDLAIYKEAIRRVDRDPARIFFVDDRPENVAAANQAGMDAVVFESPNQLAKDLKGRGVEFNY